MTSASSARPRRNLGLVVIGRNEGERLARCLRSVRDIPERVYVDSGSTDGSVALAKSEGVTVVQLPVPPFFTAARARNAGIAQLLAANPALEFVQTVDGDCEVQPGWIEAALAVLQGEPDLAVVYGRRRERFPARSIYNALCDDEWNHTVGESSGCGGDALFRISALKQVDFYNPAMIAGEEPELSMRLRKKGWRLRCIDAEMTLHDAAITHFSQWWRRTRRAGHAFAEQAYLHPDARTPNWPRTVLSIQIWGAVMPLALGCSVIAALLLDARWWVAAVAFFLPWPLKMMQLIIRERNRGLALKIASASGVLLMVGKIPQFLGLCEFRWNRFRGRSSKLIEYKGSETA